MQQALLSVLILVTTVLIAPWKTNTDVPDTPLSGELERLDHAPPSHAVKKPDPVMIRKGRELVTQGQTSWDGQKGQRISRFFVCTDCHQTVPTISDPANPTAESRLAYAQQQNIELLPASTFYGMVNRTHWYTGDYVKKYEELVEKARTSLRASIQLCAQECSQGRPLEPREMEAILQYLWQLEFRLSDLFSEDEWQQYRQMAPENQLAFLQQQYLPYLQNTFAEPVPAEDRRYGVNGNAERGAFIFEQSCMWCHRDKRVSHLELNKSKRARQFLVNRLKQDDEHSVYVVTRKGTHPIPGSKAYMPLFTRERLTDEQIEDLIAYLKSE